MFALLNPPIHGRRGRQTAHNKWFGEPERHAAAAKKGWLVRRRKHGKKIRRAKSLRTPGGGRIFSIAANRPKRKTQYNSFMGVNNPLSSNHQSGATHMAKRRRGGRRTRFNFGSGKSMVRKGVSTVKASLPIFGGVIANGLLTNWLSGTAWLAPYTRKGIGNFALGIADAGLLGWATSFVKKDLANQVFIGGIVGQLGCTFQALMQGGFKAAFGLGDDGMDGFGNINPNPYTQYSFQGMGNFTTPGAVASAIPSESSMSQYSLPHTNAQFMAPPQTPAQGAMAMPMHHHENAAVGAVLGTDDGMMGMIG